MKRLILITVVVFLFFGLSLYGKTKEPVTFTEHSTGIAPFSQVGIRHEEPVTFSRQETAYGNDVSANNWYSLDTGTMGATTISPVTYACFSGDYGLQGFFAIDYNTDNLLQIDPDTGAETIIGNMPCPMAGSGGIWSDLCCDKATGNWYAIAVDLVNNAQLYSVDITNAGITWVADFISTGTISGAVDQNGFLYTLCIMTDSTYETDLSTYITTLLGSAGIDANFAQGAAYEPIDDIFYFAAYSTGAELRSLDRVTGMTTFVGALPGETGAFGFPGSIAPAEAPAAPSDLVVTPDAGGALEAEIVWVCPTLQVNGDPLTELLEMRVYRDGVLIYTDTNPVIGGLGNYTDVPTESGLYNYSVVGYNSAGEGLSATVTVWVGEDVPNVVEDLLLVGEYGHGHLTWINPTTGLNGGAFNNAILGYHIERNDGVVFEVTGIVTEFWDTSIPGADNYYYDVTAYNSIGDGGTATSNSAMLNAGGLLIMEDFSGGVPPTGWYIDGLGQGNWSASATNEAGGTAPELMFHYSPTFTGISRMCSMPVNTEDYDELTLEFKYYVSHFSGSYTLGIATTSDGATWNTAWELINPSSIPATNETVVITTPDVGSPTFQMCFYFDGYSWNINNWNVDDVILIGPYNPSNPGFVTGTVTLEGGTGNVENVEVTAAYVTVNPDNTGYYEITILPGTFNVTATLDGYFPETVTGVVVEEGLITSGVDFTLEAVVGVDDIVTAKTELLNNYPNPFNPETNIAFSIKEAGYTTLEVYNMKGQLVKTLVNEVKESGNYTVTWNGTNNSNRSVSSGVYFYKMVSEGNSGRYTSTKKMILLK